MKWSINQAVPAQKDKETTKAIKTPIRSILPSVFIFPFSLSLASYRETVLTTIKEVEGALVREAKQREHLAGLQRQIDVAGKALDQAVERYRKGLNDNLPVLTHLGSTQRLARSLITQQAALIRYRITLHRALGGAWDGELVAPSNTYSIVDHGPD